MDKLNIDDVIFEIIGLIITRWFKQLKNNIIKFIIIEKSDSMAIPIKIGNYRLAKTLGSGSFGKVKGKYILVYAKTYK